MKLTELKPGTFTVRLYFVEPQHAEAGARVFDIALQGKTVLKDFDVFAAAHGRMKCLVKEFTSIQLDGSFTLSFNAHKGQSLLSGFELVSTGQPLDPLPENGADTLE